MIDSESLIRITDSSTNVRWKVEEELNNQLFPELLRVKKMESKALHSANATQTF